MACFVARNRSPANSPRARRERSALLCCSRANRPLSSGQGELRLREERARVETLEREHRALASERDETRVELDAERRANAAAAKEGAEKLGEATAQLAARAEMLREWRARAEEGEKVRRRGLESLGSSCDGRAWHHIEGRRSRLFFWHSTVQRGRRAMAVLGTIEKEIAPLFWHDKERSPLLHGTVHGGRLF